MPKRPLARGEDMALQARHGPAKTIGFLRKVVDERVPPDDGEGAP